MLCGKQEMIGEEIAYDDFGDSNHYKKRQKSV